LHFFFTQVSKNVFSQIYLSEKYLLDFKKIKHRSRTTLIKPGSLNFADYIKMLPSTWVFEHFLKSSNEPRKILSSSMISEAAEHFKTQVSLINQFAKLDKEDQLRCALVYLSGDNGIFLNEEPVFENSLVKSFLAFAAKDGGGDTKLFGFSEFEPHLRDVLVQTIIESAAVHDAHPSSTVPLYRSLNDITVIASLASWKELNKKRSGGLTRATSIQVKKLIDFGSVKNESGDFIANMIISYGIKEEFIFESGLQYLLNQEAFERWLLKSASDRQDSLLKFVFEYTGGWNLKFTKALLAKAHDVGLSISVFPEDDRKQVADILRAFRFAGLIDIHKKGNDFHFRVSKPVSYIDTKNHKITILPDFSAVIPQEIDQSQLFHFSQSGKLILFDRVYKGVIDRAVLSDSISRGVGSDSIVKWLASWQAPANVIETVKEWIREFHRLYVTEGAILVSVDEKVTRQINLYNPLRSLIEPLSAHTLFRIKKGQESQVREILKSMGFDYRMPGQDKEIPAQISNEPVINESQWNPVVEQEEKREKTVSSMRGTKYGAELKELELNEIIQVVDYAVLTSQLLAIDYEGSPYIKPNTYVVSPVSCQRGIEPVLEAEIPRTRTRKRFYIKKIKRIGVVSK
jgi:hypothetical protein